MEHSNDDAGSFINEYVEQNPYNLRQVYNFKSKPENTLDFLQYNTDEYKKYTLKQKVLAELSFFPLSDKYIIEITDTVFSYKKKIRWNIRELIFIHAFYVIRKYNLPISHYEFMQKTQLSVGSFFKFDKEIKHINSKETLLIQQANQIINKPTLDQFSNNSLAKNDGIIIMKKINTKNDSFSEKIYELFCENLNKLKNYSESFPEIFKLKLNEKYENNILESVSNQYENSKVHRNLLHYLNTKKDIFDISIILNTVKNKSKALIYSNTFKEELENHILKESLVAAMIKHFLKEEGIKISLSNLSKVLKIGSSGVSKASKILKNYIKI
jgi:hypothetical protein